MSTITDRQLLSDLVHHYAALLEQEKDPVQVFDFGDGHIIMPKPDPVGGSYLVRSICFLYLKGPGSMDEVPLPSMANEVFDVNGWKFIGVEFAPGETAEVLWGRLKVARDKLLIGR
jgi:hypothetical protein